MRWITRERPKIDRVACPWLITRFIDQDAVFIFVPAEKVDEESIARDAIPFDVEGVELSHDGPLCSFDAFLKKYDLENDALAAIARIVRGADTARLDLAPEAAGLLAVSLGLSKLFPDDQEMIRHGFVVYDSLYAWCRYASHEVHDWNPQRQRSSRQ
jgi:hypothetical protein